jgi:hypothetical protein
MFLTGGFTATGRGDDGAVRLLGARVAGVLSFDGAQLCNDSGPALSADGVQVGQDMFLIGGFTATGSGDVGAVILSGARIGGQLSCEGAQLRDDFGPALNAVRLQVDQDVLLTGGFTATGSGDVGAVNLRGTDIGGQLSCSGAQLRNASGPALNAEGVQVGQQVLLTGGFTATGSGDVGAVNLRGTDIGGQLSCSGAQLSNASGPALNAVNMHVGQQVYLSGGFTATGAVNLSITRIDGALSFDGAQLHTDSGSALYAYWLQVGQDVFLTGTGGFTATGRGDGGAVCLVGARVGGQLYCDGAVLRNDSGPALNASGVHVGSHVLLTGGFTATGRGDGGAVRLFGADIGGRLECDGAVLRNDSGPALVAESMQVGQDMGLTGGFTAIGSGDSRAAIDLVGARVGGTFVFAPARLEHRSHPHWRIAADGLIYAGVPEMVSARDWLRLLREGTPSYAAQPYQRLAAGYRAQGHDRQVREILMAQRDDQLARTHPSRPEWWWGKITKVTLGYGYQPWRALLFLAAVVAISCVLAVALGSHGALTQTKQTATPGQPCTVIQRVSVGLDLSLPVDTSVARVDCDLTKYSASATAAWLTAAVWVLRALIWVFAALFIAGFTSAVRKT